MKNLLKIWPILLNILVFNASFGQGGWTKPNNGYGVIQNGLSVDSALLIPTFNGIPHLARYNLGKIALSADSTTGKVYRFNPHDSSWAEIGGNNLDTFATNLKVTGTTFGKYNDGDSIQAKGKTANQVISDAIVKCNHPTYTNPTASITGSPAAGSYERGTSLSLTFSSTFTQNNAGTVGTTTYNKNGLALSGNTDAITLSANTTYTVTKTYAQGACINDNCGNQDCTGRINTGSVTSSAITYSIYDKRYYGFLNSQTPTNTQILALTQDNNGSTGTLSLSNISPSGSQFLAYFTKGTVTHVTVNAIPSDAAFTFTTYTVTNAQGVSQTYTYVYSNNAQTSTLTSVQFN